jgi:hypothetical protein
MSSSKLPNRWHLLHSHEGRQDPVPATLDFDSEDLVPAGGKFTFEAFRVGDSPLHTVMQWPFRPIAFSYPAKDILPLNAWTLESVWIQEEEQILGYIPLEGMLGAVLQLRSCPTGSKVKIRVCNEAKEARRIRLSILGRALR